MSKPFVYVGLSQAAGIYELTLGTDNCEVIYHAPLDDLEALGQQIMRQVAEQRERDAEPRA